jgi:4-hydroxy-3-polyprenylbenzoate decarboxylase
VAALKQYMTHTKNPVCVIAVVKEHSQKKFMKKLRTLSAHIHVAVIVEHRNNDLDDPYMLVWRVVNNIDAQRDVKLKELIVVDATNKGELDGFEREWPGDTFCTKEVLDTLQQKGLIKIDESFIKRFGLLPFN